VRYLRGVQPRRGEKSWDQHNGQRLIHGRERNMPL
jgi:hypothetical protein